MWVINKHCSMYTRSDRAQPLASCRLHCDPKPVDSTGPRPNNCCAGPKPAYYLLGLETCDYSGPKACARRSLVTFFDFFFLPFDASFAWPFEWPFDGAPFVPRPA